MVKQYTDADVVKHGDSYERIYADKADLEYAPPAWMARGLQETASGYGKRLNSGLKIHFNGKRYRIYVTIFSNCGTAWFQTKGRKIIVD